jgi:hypothetical protein
MPIAINGSGTLTGLSVGGLEDGIITPAELSTGGPGWDAQSNLTNVASINAGPLAGMRNAIINGGMHIAQRGPVSLSNNTAVYGGCDRWVAGLFNFTTATGTVTKAGTANPLNEIVATTTGTNANQIVVFSQRIEAANAAHLSGQPITVSATLYQDTGSAIAPVFNLYKPNAEDNWSSATFVASITLASLASLGRVRYTWTVTLGATDANNGLALEIAFPIAAAITSKYFQISEVQLEPGPVATPFERRPIGTELSLCQRYYEISEVNRSVFSGNVTNGQGYRTNVAFQVAKRTTPTVTLTNAENSSFSTTVGSVAPGLQGFAENRTANSTERGIYISNWTASAEL